MTHLAPRPDRLAHYAGHAALGYDFLVLLVLRLLWRWANPVPPMPAGTKRWRRDRGTHGHAGTSALLRAGAGGDGLGARRQPCEPQCKRMSSGIPFPAIASGGEMHEVLEESHEVLAYLLAILIVVHIVGALRHHFVKKNDVLRRMAA